MPLPIAVLISGGGSTLKNLIDRREANRLDIDFRLVISSRADAGGLSYAATANIPSMVVPKKKSVSAEVHSNAIFDPIRQSGAKLVVMGGFLQHVLIPSDFENRVINIHPSLIPSFCGQGMYGLRVHEAAIAFGVRISGCTVHYVDNQYDHGPIILQKACAVFEQDTALELQKRVLQLEYEALPEAITKIAPRF
ncbi:MAG: phosphoribosylglycinamide formyltransferase [Pirellula sp.]|jgi:phosphoribosylglycinamide formyltransferase-1|nr:phosphoribosylglycinamide formyltransferase [Pirellula sp.]